MYEQKTSRLNEGRGAALLWVVSLMGPVVWLMQLQTNYMLTYWVCRTGNRLVFPLVGLVALAILAWGAHLAWRLRKEGENERPDDAYGRIRLMTTAGLAGCGFFALVVIATAIPGVFQGGCL